VSINRAAKYTNHPGVELTIAAPDTATGVVVSNDGGFAHPRTMAPSASRTYPWTLRSTGRERLPKTVYVRFAGPCSDPAQSFQDDVILDQTRPRILRARVTRPAGPGKGRATPTLSLRATDNASGLSRAQVRYRAGRRARTFAVRFRNRFRLTASATRVRVRVRDGAGNFSRWKTAVRR
jgi:hypothetical protein